MTQTIRAVLFDLDGTLVDTAPDFIEVVNQLRQRYQQPPLDPALIRSHVSDGARALTQLAFGGQEGEPEFEHLKQELLNEYLEIAGNTCLLFEGFEPLLSFLEAESIDWGIVTNKPRVYTDQILRRMDLEKRCAVTICPDELTQAKPSPEGLFKAAEKLGIPPSDILYVGDHQRDIEAGQRAGMPNAAVKFGYLKHPDDAHSWNADYVISHPRELTPLVITSE